MKRGGVGRSDFQADARVLRRGLMDNGYRMVITRRVTLLP